MFDRESAVRILLEAGADLPNSNKEQAYRTTLGR